LAGNLLSQLAWPSRRVRVTVQKNGSKNSDEPR
jgi:hypothetical protein